MFTKTDIEPFENKIWLASPTMHGEELEYIQEAFEKNWITTAGENVNTLETRIADYLSSHDKENLYTVGLGTGTSAIHLALKLAGLSVTPGISRQKGMLYGQKVFVSDLTFNATVNPVIYEGGEPVFIDSEYETWNMDPDALETAFQYYPDTRIVIVANLYGTPGQLERIRSICDIRNAVLIEDAAESFGAYIHTEGRKRQTGTFGDYGIISFNGNKVITGSSGGMLITSDETAAAYARKWSTQAREAAPWYQHEELGYNYRISNIVAGIARGQLLHLDEHIKRKKEIWKRYEKGLRDLPVRLNPHMAGMEPNYWLSCMIINSEAMCKQVRSDHQALYIPEPEKSCPTEILEVLEKHNAQGRPIWKPMHLQPVYRSHGFVVKNKEARAATDAYIEHSIQIVDEDIFERGLCLPSDIKMKPQEQDRVIEMIKGCFE